jgi:hypothetical protein
LGKSLGASFKEKNALRIILAIQSREDFYEVRDQIKNFWYKNNGEVLSINKMIILSLNFFRDYLANELDVKDYDCGRQDINRYSRIKFKGD